MAPRGSPFRPRHDAKRPPTVYFGHAQLSLVEHALCPLDTQDSLGESRVFESEYSFTDRNRHRRRARVRVACPEGLSPTDEFYLWGLLSLTFSQPKPTADFYATPYYCLRQLGCIHPKQKRVGGRDFALFRASISRLSTVSYRNDHFYDPIRGEHRDVGFGFLSYSLPLDPGSCRAWRFAWDPLFFEFCSAAAGALRFDFETYRALDPASRRLYLLLKKVFWRSESSPEFDLRDLAVNALGFSGLHETWRLKQKLACCIEVLASRQAIRLPAGAANGGPLFSKRGPGQYSIRFLRGPHFETVPSPAGPSRVADSPLYDPLHTIGLDDAAIRHVLKTYDPRLVAECADMTLAARERFGNEFFKNSPQAYFVDNLKAQASRKRTPPDWWRELRKQEERRRWQADDEAEDRSREFDRAFEEYLKTEAREAFGRVMDKVFSDLTSGGQSEQDARRNAEHFARIHFSNRFRAEHPEWRTGDDSAPSIDALTR